MTLLTPAYVPQAFVILRDRPLTNLAIMIVAGALILLAAWFVWFVFRK